MKLVEIKNVRVGQIRKIEIMDFHGENTKEVIGVFTRANDSSYDEFDWIAEYYDYETKKSIGDYEDWTFEDCGELVGKLGITHKIEDNRLVEIKREGFQVDDVVKFIGDDSDRIYIIQREKKQQDIFPNNKCFKCLHELYGDREIFDFELKKVGIYGLTHEFVNDSEE